MQCFRLLTSSRGQQSQNSSSAAGEFFIVLESVETVSPAQHPSHHGGRVDAADPGLHHAHVVRVPDQEEEVCAVEAEQ